MCILARCPNFLPTRQILSKSPSMPGWSPSKAPHRDADTKEVFRMCSLSPEARARKSEYQAWIRCHGLSFQGCSGLGKGSRSALGPGGPDSFLSCLGGVGKSLHSWQLEGEGGRKQDPWDEAGFCTTHDTEALPQQICKAGWIIWGQQKEEGGKYIVFLRAVYKLKENIISRLRQNKRLQKW